MIRALHFRDVEAFRARRVPGSFIVDVPRGGGDRPARLCFWCPCGCGAQGDLPIVAETSAGAADVWQWNGSLTEPTLDAPVRRAHCGWRGRLHIGYWERQ